MDKCNRTDIPIDKEPITLLIIYGCRS